MPDLSENPYSSVAIPAFAPVAAATTGVYRDGPFLIVQNGAKLPPICPMENRALDFSAKELPKSHNLLWMPPSALLTMVASAAVLIFLRVKFASKDGAWILLLAPAVIRTFTTKKNGSVTYGFCRTAQRRIRLKTLAIFALLFGAVASFCGYIIQEPPDSWIYLGLMVACAIAAFVLAYYSNPIRVAGYRNPGWFKLKGCSPAFLETLEPVSFETLS